MSGNNVEVNPAKSKSPDSGNAVNSDNANTDPGSNVGPNVEPSLTDKMAKYAEIVANQKQQMVSSLDKQQMVDIIFKQNSVITQQSSQMIDLVNLVNDMEQESPAEEKGESGQEPSTSQQNIDILKNRNDMCRDSDELRRHGSMLFESSVKIQFILFTLFILVLFWLIYHFSSFDGSN